MKHNVHSYHHNPIQRFTMTQHNTKIYHANIHNTIKDPITNAPCLQVYYAILNEIKCTWYEIPNLVQTKTMIFFVDLP
jgi:hypothetical protein